MQVSSPDIVVSTLFETALTKMAKALDSKQGHTSFGRLPMSHEQTACDYAFGKASRDAQAKVFLGELTVQENLGKKSPGPVY